MSSYQAPNPYDAPARQEVKKGLRKGFRIAGRNKDLRRSLFKSVGRTGFSHSRAFLNRPTRIASCNEDSLVVVPILNPLGMTSEGLNPSGLLISIVSAWVQWKMMCLCRRRFAVLY